MPTSVKTALIAALIAVGVLIAALLGWLGGGDPLPVPSPSPSAVASVLPSPSPVASASPIPVPSTQKTFIIEGFERPEFATASQWKPSVTRTILDGQVTSFVLKSSDPCGLVSVPGIQKMMPVTLTKPSAPSYTAGVYYDALFPLTALNCATAKYLQLDASTSVQIGDASIILIRKLTKAPAMPVVPLSVDFNNWTMVLGYGGSTVSTGTDALQALQLLKNHRMNPYKGQEVANLAGWNQYVLPFAQGPVYMGLHDAPSFTVPVLPDSYAYIMDEPQIGNTATISTYLKNWKTKAPSVKPMLTTSIRQRDYRQTVGGVTNPNFAKLVDWPADIKADVKIFVVVAEQFCQETWANSGDIYPCKAEYDAAGKDLWFYVSNMSHGNEGGPATGAPDLVIDRSAVEPFGFFLMALKFEAKALLYYNTIEAWPNQDVLTNPYVYGGNGDGILLYPDKPNKKAMASIRLKLLREASQWADIVSLAGKQAGAKALMTTTLKWDHTLSKFEALRTEALSVLQ